VEGGATIHAQLLAEGLADEVVCYTAPLLCGTGRPLLDAAYFGAGSVRLREVKWKALGEDVRLTGLISRA
jgi:riboflavin biosynthesis pyrimidine reductase